jgi:hypothetical protein
LTGGAGKNAKLDVTTEKKGIYVYIASKKQATTTSELPNP